MGQTIADPHQGTILHSGGQLPARRGEELLRRQQQEIAVRQRLRQIESETRIRAFAQRGQLVVPVNEPIKSSELIPKLFNINRLGYGLSRDPTVHHPATKRPKQLPNIIQNKIDPVVENTDTKNSPGIVVYGIDSATGASVPILIIKTKLISKRVETKFPALSNDVVTRRPTAPLVVDLSQYDGIRNAKPWCDAFIINVGGDFAFLGGTGAGLQIVIIVKGQDQGIYVYRPTAPNANLGLILSAGIATGTVYFNEYNNRHIKLDRQAFEGNSQGWSAGYGPLGVGVATSYADGKRHYLDIWNMGEEDVLYRAYSGSSPGMGLSFDINIGAQYSFSRSALWLSFKF